jgi:hypothetical protein
MLHSVGPRQIDLGGFNIDVRRLRCAAGAEDGSSFVRIDGDLRIEHGYVR